MKKGTPDHPKTIDLSARLKINRAWACGILELLWSFTRDYAPEGDVGRFSDTNIALAAHWPKSPTILISALIEFRWLNTCPIHRLAIHDWEDHCDDYTRKKLSRSGSKVVPCATKSGHCPDNVQTISDTSDEVPGQSLASRARSALPCLASALPVPESGPRDDSPLPPGNDLCSWFETEFKGEWLPNTWQAFPKYVNGACSETFRENVSLWMKTKKYMDGYGTNSVKFLSSGVWKKPPTQELMAKEFKPSGWDSLYDRP